MTDSTFHFVIPSDYSRMREVQEPLMAAVEAHRFNDEAVFAIRISLEEGLINAMKHGNRLDAHKHVTVDARITDRQAEFLIHDQGPGFDRGKVPDPTHEDNLEKSSGRGLLLIESYMTDVSYDDKGRRLRMVFKKKG